ncbi:MAG: xanthine dehydrogenase family protein [Thermomicrobiales bacterium]|nr:xanthine dehydrogenase family protein [Thermomicrobiales bacterium]
MVLSSYVGATVRRKEDPRLITGSSTYVDDLQLPGLVSVAFVRSPYAHARINGIDGSAALAIPGVHAVITAADLKKVMKTFYQEPTGGETGEDANEDAADDAGIPVPPVLPLADVKVRWVGDAVAAVVADSVQIAEDAAALVEVDWDVLEAVIDPFEALEDGAPQLYDDVKNNISVIEQTVHGDVEGALASSAIRVKARIRSPRCHPMPMEPRGIVVAPDAMTQGLTIWTSTQAPHWNRNSIAEALGFSQSQVRAIAPEVGGGFGAKIGAYPEEFVVAAAAVMLRRPVKWMETRSENFLTTNHGRNQWAEFEAGADATGKLTALKANIVLDSGAYPKALDLAWCTWVMSTGPYVVPNLEYKVTGVYTNTMANGAYRGAGRPEAAFYLERVMDLIADEGELDPAEVRRVNFIPPDQFPYTTLSGEHYDTGEYDKPLTKALEVAGYQQLRQEQAEARKQGRYLGIGVSAYVEICGFGPFDSATVRVEPSGDVSVFTGISPHGQGQETTFAQLAADYIGADYDRVVVHHGDTSNTPQGHGTMGSRGLAVGGAALVLSLNKIKERASRIAAHLLEAAIEDIELVDGKYQVKGVPSGGLTLSDIAEKAYSGDLPDEIGVGLTSTDFFKPADETFPFGAHIAVVEVFPETGETKILRYVSVDDCGNIISPMLVTGQVHGGLAQGMGQVLWEELHYDASGELITGTLNDYAVPKAAYFPEFETHHTTTTTPINPLGAKGIGEAATIGSTPALTNAVIDALEPFGITHLDIPFTAEKIWRAINSAQTASAAD